MGRLSKTILKSIPKQVTILLYTNLATSSFLDVLKGLTFAHFAK